MRFVLYIITWIFVVQTISELVQGAFDEFTAGLFVSGLMVWWSVSVRNRRKRKLAAAAGYQAEAKQSNWDRAWGELKTESSALVSRKKSKTDSQTTGSVDHGLNDAPVEATKQETETPFTLDAATPTAVETLSETHGLESTEPEPIIEDAAPATEADLVAVEPEVQPEQADEVQAPERPLWSDAHGKPLHVGAKVSFLANSRGQSVAIPGVLLGERDGKALIEVGSGALLPKNDYAIPWNVVSLVD